MEALYRYRAFTLVTSTAYLQFIFVFLLILDVKLHLLRFKSSDRTTSLASKAVFFKTLLLVAPVWVSFICWPPPFVVAGTYENKKLHSWFQTLALFWMLYAFFWVIPWRLNFICRCFETLYLFLLHRQVGMKDDWVWEMLGYLYATRFGLKIAWASRKQGDRIGVGPSKERGCGV